VLIEPIHRGYRIEVRAELVDSAWDATVRIRRVLSDARHHVEHVACRKVTPGLAERVGAIHGRRWVDLHSGPA
jgi:hypothetical protein